MSSTGPTKADLRHTVLTRRRARTVADREAAAVAIAAHAASAAPVAAARRVAAYLSMPSEPGTGPLLADLHARGVEVLVPLSLADHTLRWVPWRPGDSTTTTGLGIPEPTAAADATTDLADVDLVVLPALAVDHRGGRLGRGAGYYDRALADLEVLRCAIVFADELLDEVPTDPHDVPVDLVLTEAGVFRPER